MMADPEPQSVTQSDVVRLRRTTETDLDFVLATEYHEDNYQYIFHWNRDQHILSFANPNIAHFIIETVEDRRAVGYAIINDLQNPNESFELQRLAMADKGKGYGRSAVNLIKKWAFEQTNAHRLWLDVKDYNLRARRVYEAEGFVFEGTLREVLKVGDKFESLVYMSVLRSEYEASK